jgi:hypothetical protein
MVPDAPDLHPRGGETPGQYFHRVGVELNRMAEELQALIIEARNLIERLKEN